MKTLQSPCPSIELARLVKSCEGSLDRGEGVSVTRVTHDSRRVVPGALFVAVPGKEHDGMEFVPDAVAAGAVAVVSERPRPEGDGSKVAWIRVKNARAALADLSFAFWRHPDRRLLLIGVTGTNGKTSTAWMLERALVALGRPVALLGSLVYRFGDAEESATHTTPEAPVLGRILHHAVESGAWGAVMEVSSHALSQERVRGLTYGAAVFTNLEPEHLDFHGDLERYFRAKARLYTEGLGSDGLSVFNADDPRGREIGILHDGPTISFGRSKEADLRIASLKTDLSGLQMKLTGAAELQVASPLIGATSALNLAAVAATLLGIGFDPEEIGPALESVPNVPGRMETVREGQPFTVLFDYAHTEAALERLLITVRETGARRIHLVFGCGGERDAQKRPNMGAVAARLADVVVFTNDNPRREDPDRILEDILAGAHSEEGEAVLLVERRRERALAMAFLLAQEGDAIVAAGKGNEAYQEIGTTRHPWSERDVLRQYALDVAEGRPVG